MKNQATILEPLAKSLDLLDTVARKPGSSSPQSGLHHVAKQRTVPVKL